MGGDSQIAFNGSHGFPHCFRALLTVALDDFYAARLVLMNYAGNVLQLGKRPFPAPLSAGWANLSRFNLTQPWYRRLPGSTAIEAWDEMG